MCCFEYKSESLPFRFNSVPLLVFKTGYIFILQVFAISFANSVFPVPTLPYSKILMPFLFSCKAFDIRFTDTFNSFFKYKKSFLPKLVFLESPNRVFKRVFLLKSILFVKIISIKSFVT